MKLQLVVSRAIYVQALPIKFPCRDINANWWCYSFNILFFYSIIYPIFLNFPFSGQYVNPAQVEEYIRFQEGSFICTICGKDFPQHKSNCKRHIILVHANPAEETKCPICHKTYRTEQSMKSHMRQTHGIYANKD